MTDLTRRDLLAFTAGAACVGTLPGTALAQPVYPNRPLRLIVPFPPSGSTDIVARTVAERLGAALGQNVIVDNKPGATGAIGLEALARAEADGHVIGLGTIGSIAINPAVNRKLAWDPVRDFAPVGYIGSTPFALIVRPDLKARTVPEFIALARQQPGAVTYATGGNGGSQHVAGVLLEDLAGVSLRQIPYKGSGPALIDLMGGQVDAMIEPAVSAAPHIRSGKVRALALTGAQRSASFPGVPVVGETVPGYDVSAWFALFAPKQTPPAAIARLNRELGQILRDPQVIDRLGQAGVEVAPGSPEQLATYLGHELEKWQRVVKKANITAE
ncbi:MULTISPECIES: Bug family tripartite tricarboxylate transporter substrate binding protein [Ramlibacter]|uniref:Tripartite tricarboxylate transporter substrate binding protein n=1 Tax=Ramlibacter pinisoli TaxID=2682844 RepID=A0A6N8J038_9BURK|nr:MULTISPECIES: tripartite tricarboxylate transporter substrate binding protein [Ramlibacter]MBA2962662.1 tripartite tricarboxylate transporter substrate binding protein [Ramlibacter sp. CGMCC 1.13660]MVQ32604.1 tripartite tricarboxylate transporter substrate binding protein [Ramlibacter pinisoli]